MKLPKLRKTTLVDTVAYTSTLDKFAHVTETLEACLSRPGRKTVIVRPDGHGRPLVYVGIPAIHIDEALAPLFIGLTSDDVGIPAGSYG